MQNLGKNKKMNWCQLTLDIADSYWIYKKQKSRQHNDRLLKLYFPKPGIHIYKASAADQLNPSLPCTKDNLLHFGCSCWHYNNNISKSWVEM